MPADDWDTHMLFFLNHGYRVIAHDRRVSFMDHDLGYFDLETRVLEPLENPFGPKVLPMS